MLKKYTCIICPLGCDIEATVEQDLVIAITGNSCPKGVDYVSQELANPLRNIATSVLIKNGDLPLVSVRLDRPIPKAEIFPAMAEIKRLCVTAPVQIGQVLLRNVAGTGADLIATKKIRATG
ncbi:DUF1667 domain-containing protein [Pelobacter seleniigenes]|uniref:DUF1667 domain-containing protein n=1 Tax=Pelobacter seleniigenes TaxID=407188 RepID=UPI0004A746A7|nr:DUF1667 domain-containing protein [Pelobacter seleniigenes]